MPGKLKLLAVMVCLGIFYGCASKAPPGELRNGDASMIYGHISVSDDEINNIELREYGKVYIPPFINPPRVLVFKNGNFMAENLPPGNYYIARLSSRKTDYTLVNDLQTSYQWVIKVLPSSSQFVGAYHITNIEPGNFARGKFDFRSSLQPTERRILKHMYEVTSGTAWQTLIERRIKELN